MPNIELPEGKLTKFEKSRIIGSRALQLSMGAPFLVELSEEKLESINYNPVEIAKIEYKEGVIPMQIKRRKPMPEEVED